MLKTPDSRLQSRLKTADFEYHLPAQFIAQSPLKERDQARLMVLERASGRVRHAVFREIADFLSSGDLLVLNDTRVLPARFIGRRERTGGRVEVLLIEPADAAVSGQRADMGVPAGAGQPPTLRSQPSSLKPMVWLAFTGSGGKLRPGERIIVADAGVAFLLLERLGEAGDLVAIQPVAAGAHGKAGRTQQVDPYVLMQRFGHTPLPPYIRRGRNGADTPEDAEYYQTVYARRPGAVAAPTAGLHFTERLLEALDARGIRKAWLTLHVGPGTFRPVKTATPDEHVMHSERYEAPAATIEQLLAARRAGNRVVAVGTTVARVLETLAASGFPDCPTAGRTDLFIRPPYQFRLVDALVTNFHLPRSTLLMLVAAFAGLERTLAAYEEAKRGGYRFFSYGDAMLII